MAPDGAAPPSNVQETARNLVGCASLHRTVGRLRTLPWDAEARAPPLRDSTVTGDRKSTRLNSSHLVISYAVFCLKKKKNKSQTHCESANRTKLTWLAGERSYWGFS